MLLRTWTAFLKTIGNPRTTMCFTFVREQRVSWKLTSRCVPTFFLQDFCLFHPLCLFGCLSPERHRTSALPPLHLGISRTVGSASLGLFPSSSSPPPLLSPLAVLLLLPGARLVSCSVETRKSRAKNGEMSIRLRDALRHLPWALCQCSHPMVHMTTDASSRFVLAMALLALL